GSKERILMYRKADLREFIAEVTVFAKGSDLIQLCRGALIGRDARETRRKPFIGRATDIGILVDLIFSLQILIDSLCDPGVGPLFGREGEQTCGNTLVSGREDLREIGSETTMADLPHLLNQAIHDSDLSMVMDTTL